MCLVVDYGDKGAPRVELVGRKLREGSQCRIGGKSGRSKGIIVGGKGIKSAVARRSGRGTAIEGIIDGVFGCTVISVARKQCQPMYLLSGERQKAPEFVLITVRPPANVFSPIFQRQ